MNQQAAGGTLTREQVALAAEYMAMVITVSDTSIRGEDYSRVTVADWGRLRGLVLRCMAELPTSLWKRILEAVLSPPGTDLFNRIVEEDLRLDLMPYDPLPPELRTWHGPGIGNQQGPFHDPPVPPVPPVPQGPLPTPNSPRANRGIIKRIAAAIAEAE